MSTTRRIIRFLAVSASCVVLALSASVVTPADAAPPSRFARGERVDLALAAWVHETDTSLTDLTLRIFDSAERDSELGPVNYKNPGLILFYVDRHIDQETGIIVETNYEAFSGNEDFPFRFERSLGGAEATFSVPAYGYRCTSQVQGISEASCVELDPAVIDGHVEWTGDGPVFRDVVNLRENQAPQYMFGSNQVFAARAATANGSVVIRDGDALAEGVTDIAVLVRGRYHYQLLEPSPGP